MTRLALLAALGLSGCFHPSYDHPACPDGDCPDGLTCVAGVCESQSDHDAGDDAIGDAPDGDIAPPDANNDRDNDTIADDIDNCPDVANTAQANEDGDAFGDACDPCPIDTDNADTDGDGVAASCDPNPGTGGDHIYLFEGFSGTTLPQSLKSVGTWTFANSKASSASLGTVANLAFPSGGITETITTVVTVDNFANQQTSYAGMADNFRVGSTDGWYCQLEKQQPSNFQLHELQLPSGALDKSNGTSIAEGTPYKLFMLHDDHLVRCTKDMTTISNNATGLPPAAPHGILYVANSSASFDYLLVVTSP
ncbi:MAG TPA: hypothetical protein VGM90_07090 [Kofleriaceae bacterium]|jgi:hypothetical protein